MRSGLMRSTVVYSEIGEETIDDDGQPQRTWPPLGTFRAFIRNLNGRELLQAQRIEGQVSLVISHRYQGFPIRPSGRYTMGDRTFNIGWADNVDSRNREIRAYVTEVVS